MHLKRGSKTLGMLTNEIKPGIRTLYLENTICASINENMY